ncbi:MAG: protoporphyrinogen oxidase HemJ [Natronospirillum sp.]|uniref:protoporphyrinogen oxidase HemJ n=1 Tax=Natronospirillum sp. TaxID=2812955 RepID=UPI0025ED269A|nr:protoporphyrinogen oxidase HemJ [Natronospirillum sp.]MCH8553467.1 protoporphyrinogen oxidase HemJ [Natronospirillum sp.]
MTYLYVKAFHLIAMVAWYAGLFYLPRLFVYHAQATDQISRDRFEIMERRLFRGIMTPAMVLTLALGIWMLWLHPFWLQVGWMHAKLALVVVLVIYHHICLAHMKQLARGTNRRSHVYFRWFNEVPLIPLVGIVLLAVLKPF